MLNSLKRRLMIKFIDLFAGIGGTRLGFEQACKQAGIEYECVFSSEIDKKACETYKRNFNEEPLGDIRELIDNIPKFDFLLAGFPCQPFSYAGKKKGFGDTRGTLFFEVEKILKKYQPKGFLLENVRGLTTHDNGGTFKTIIWSLENLGYKVTDRLLNSSNFGVPQNRVRVYIVGLRGEVPKIEIQSDRGFSDSHKFKTRRQGLFDNAYEYKTVADILENSPRKKYNCSSKFTEQLATTTKGDFDMLHGIRLIDYRNGKALHSWELGIKGECTKDEIEFMNMLIENRRKKKFGEHQDGKKLTLEQVKTFNNHPDIEAIIKSLITKGYLQEKGGRYDPVAGNMSFEVFKFLDPDSISITLVSSDAHKLGVVHNNKPRRITPRECARLQGFPDSFELHPKDSASYKQFGNTVSVPVIKALISEVLKNNKIL